MMFRYVRYFLIKDFPCKFHRTEASGPTCEPEVTGHVFVQAGPVPFPVIKHVEMKIVENGVPNLDFSRWSLVSLVSLVGANRS
jgi:hypothetical protein